MKNHNTKKLKDRIDALTYENARLQAVVASYEASEQELEDAVRANLQLRESYIEAKMAYEEAARQMKTMKRKYERQLSNLLASTRKNIRRR